MKITILGILLSAVFLLGTVGCANASTVRDIDEGGKGQVTIELTPRQIAILEEQGFAGDYNELDIAQKSAIESIESLLRHLEETYGECFCYLGYISGLSGERECLIAYPASGSEEEEITVYRYIDNGTVVFEDNYALVKARPLYEKTVKSLVSEYVDARCFVVFSDMLSAESEGLSEGNVRRKAAAATCVFIDEENCTWETYEQLVQACEAWLKDNFHGESENIRLLLTKQEEVYLISRSEAFDKVAEDIFSADTLCMITQSGEVSCY